MWRKHSYSSKINCLFVTSSDAILHSISLECSRIIEERLADSMIEMKHELDQLKEQEYELKERKVGIDKRFTNLEIAQGKVKVFIKSLVQECQSASDVSSSV